MGEVAMKVTGLLPKISSLFNSPKFSDVQFIFTCDDGINQRIFGHKLVLALRSKVFASMFFEDKDSVCEEVRIPASKKLAFSHLLRFLYTDDVQFHTFEEAKELFELANEYAVDELGEKCSNYILHETITIQNVFPKYECAIVQNMQVLLKDCQNFTCANTHLVLESGDFKNASVKVVEDIVKLDDLSVSSELQIIKAVLKWGSEELKRNKMLSDEKYLRKCIEPLMKHIRFLTLSLREFDYFIANFNIFTGYESSILTRKICQPDCDVDFPYSLCPISTKRGEKQSSKSMPITQTQKGSFHKSTPEVFPPARTSPMSHVNNSSQNSAHKILHSVSYDSTNMLDTSNSKIFNTQESPAIRSSKLGYEVKKYPFSNVAKVSQSNFQTKFISTPNIVDKKYSQPIAFKPREFGFSLQESQSCLGTSFPKDVKSTLSFKMITGNMCLLGVELTVKNNNSKSSEKIGIDVYLKGFSKSPFSHQFEEELKGDVLTVKFPDKMILQEGSKGVLDVSIDNLFLNRCSNCNINNGCSLNIGLGFKCDISLSSTLKLPEMDNNFIFLINKLIYVPC